MQGLSSKLSHPLPLSPASNDRGNKVHTPPPLSSQMPDNEIQQFLDYIAQGLTLGIKSFHIFNPHIPDSLYVSFIHRLIEPLHRFIKDPHTEILSVDLPNSVVTFSENKKTVFIEMNGEKKIILMDSIVGMTKKIYDDMDKHRDCYGIELVTYVKNLAHYGDTFEVFNKRLSPSGFKKNAPYLTMGESRLINNVNCRYTFYDSNDSIVCADFSAQVATSMLKDETGKFDWTRFQSKKNIQDNMPKSIEDTYDFLKNHASHYDLIKNKEFGCFIRDRFREMQTNEHGNKINVFLVESINHSMMVRLRLKTILGKPVYVVSFYDPNKTNTIVRCETHDLSDIEGIPLRQYIDGSHAGKLHSYQSYYYDDADYSLIIACDIRHLDQPPAVKPVKRLYGVDRFAVTPTLIFHLVTENFFHDFNALKDQLHQIGMQSPNRLIDLLSIKVGKEMPLLYFCLKMGYTEIISTLLELITPLAGNTRCTDLILAKRDDGKPGIVTAVKFERLNTLAVYFTLLKLIPNRSICDEFIRSLYFEHGLANMELVLHAGFSNSVILFVKLIKLISDKKIQTELISSEIIAETLNFHKAMELGSTKAIIALGTLLPLMKDDLERATFLSAKNSRGITGLCSAIRYGNRAAISLFGELLAHISDEALRTQLIIIPTALVSGETEVLETYFELFQLIPPCNLPSLTADKSSEVN